MEERRIKNWVSRWPRKRGPHALEEEHARRRRWRKNKIMCVTSKRWSRKKPPHHEWRKTAPSQKGRRLQRCRIGWRSTDPKSEPVGHWWGSSLTPAICHCTHARRLLRTSPARDLQYASQFTQNRVGVARIGGTKLVVERTIVKGVRRGIGGPTFTITAGVVNVFEAVPKADAACKYSARSL